jgi:cytochrome c
MSMFRFGILLAAAALCLVSSVCKAQHPNLGRPLTPEEVSKLDITVTPEGSGLPPGSGSVSAGAKVYADKCQSCHGAKGQGGPQDQLTGGIGTAYILSIDGVVPQDAVLDAKSLPQVKMPNRDGFVRWWPVPKR